MKLSEDGHEALLAVEVPDELLGAISTLDGGPRTADVVALEPVEAQLVPATDFDRYLDEHQRGALVLLRTVVGRLRESDRWRAEFSQGASSRGSPVTSWHRCGVSRDTVSRAISHLRAWALSPLAAAPTTVLDVSGMLLPVEFPLSVMRVTDSGGRTCNGEPRRTIRGGDMNDRQINDVSSKFPHGADELDLVPEALKDLTAGAGQADAVRGGGTLKVDDQGCYEAETM